MFGEGFDLAAVASAAGMGGSAVAAVSAAVIFKGLLMRIITQVIVTAALTGVGFLALLSFLGFEIVPKDEPVAAFSAPAPDGSESFSVQSVPAPGSTAEAEPDDGKRTFAVKSPFRKG
jgi:hypothetical protein